MVEHPRNWGHSQGMRMSGSWISVLFLTVGIYFPMMCAAFHSQGTRAAGGLLPVAREINIDLHIFQRDSDDGQQSPATTASGSTQTSTAIITQTQAPSATPSGSSLTIPRPFDTSLGNNFTQPSCPNFFNSFINDPTFQQCVPYSLLLQNSAGFFQAAMYNSTLTPILDASCNVQFDTCNTLMTTLAGQLISSQACAEDYGLGNALVVQAYRGLLSYAPMYRAACLKADPKGKTVGNSFPYCYASAINSSSEADSELYFLPLGDDLPSGLSISCSSCTQQTMAIFASAAINASSPLNGDYLPAANMVNTACGSGFVNASSSITKSPSTSTPNSAASNSPPYTLVFVSWLAILLALATVSYR